MMRDNESTRSMIDDINHDRKAYDQLVAELAEKEALIKELMAGTSFDFKKCTICGHKPQKIIKRPILDTPDVNRLLDIMKRHKINLATVCKTLGLSPSTMTGWIRHYGNIKPIYFEILKLKGYE